MEPVRLELELEDVYQSLMVGTESGLQDYGRYCTVGSLWTQTQKSDKRLFAEVRRCSICNTHRNIGECEATDADCFCNHVS